MLFLPSRHMTGLRTCTHGLMWHEELKLCMIMCKNWSLDNCLIELKGTVNHATSRENLYPGFQTWSDTNQAIQPQKMLKGLEFLIKEKEWLYYLCSAKQRHRLAAGCDQLRGVISCGVWSVAGCDQLQGVISCGVWPAEECDQLQGVISCRSCRMWSAAGCDQLRGVISCRLWSVAGCDQLRGGDQLKSVISCRVWSAAGCDQLRGVISCRVWSAAGCDQLQGGTSWRVWSAAGCDQLRGVISCWVWPA